MKKKQPRVVCTHRNSCFRCPRTSKPNTQQTHTLCGHIARESNNTSYQSIGPGQKQRNTHANTMQDKTDTCSALQEDGATHDRNRQQVSAEQDKTSRRPTPTATRRRTTARRETSGQDRPRRDGTGERGRHPMPERRRAAQTPRARSREGPAHRAGAKRR